MPPKNPPRQQHATAATSATASSAEDSGLPWSEKYRPKRISQMCYPVVANKLKLWLETFNISNPAQKRAVLLSGPPGIGKTTSVHVVAQELGVEVIEFNASDHRSQKTLRQHVNAVTDNCLLTGGWLQKGVHSVDSVILGATGSGSTKTAAHSTGTVTPPPSPQPKKRGSSRSPARKATATTTTTEAKPSSAPLISTPSVSALQLNSQLHSSSSSSLKFQFILLMDEVDGCDRGGVTEVIQMIKTTKIPILCTCNDRYAQKLKSLLNHVEDMKVARSPFPAVASYITDKILTKERVSVPKNVLGDIIKLSGSDIRYVLNNLQMWTLTQKSMTDKSLIHAAKSSTKNEDLGLFDTAEAFFVKRDRSAPPKTYEELQSAFYSSDLMDLFVQENYLHYKPDSGGDWLRAVARASNSISQSDDVQKIMFYEQNWSVSTTHVYLSSIYPSRVVSGQYQSFVTGPQAHFDKARPIKFPSWLGNNSTMNKNIRLLTCLAKEGTHAVEGYTGGNTDLILDYIPLVLEGKLSKPLAEQEKQGIPQVVSVMEQYHLGREDWDFTQEVTQFKKMTSLPSPFLHHVGKVATATKSAFTREFNKGHKLESVAKAGLKNMGTASRGFDTVGGAEELPNEEEEEEETCALFPKPGAKKAAPKKATTAPAPGGKAPRAKVAGRKRKLDET